ncbi:MAG: hypothetical protein IKG27_01345 [Bacilli bacterium]|nr:hypothetical protein [Bacilli bacterium]
MDKKEIQRSVKIDMKYFLETYYEITNQELLNNLTRLTHKDIKRVLELYGIEIKRTCFQTLTREMVASGEVVLVIDGYGNVAPYKNPFCLVEERNEPKIKRREYYDKYQRR